MDTTVAVRRETLEMLKSIKEETRAGSFDEVIRGVIAEAKKPTESFFGKFKKIPSFKREEIDRFD